jgi:ubiquinone biosynthesis protein
MKWIRTGRQIGQAVKNVQRLRQILSVFAKHGFADIVERMNLSKFLPSRFAPAVEEEAELTPAQRLRMSFEELGPTFIKFGQLLSTRSDLLPEVFIEEFVKLQDNVQPLPFEVVRAVIEKELGKKLEEAYTSFNPKPLAAASIGQVHEAELLGGQRVVVKVQRPEIGKIIETDVSLLVFLAGLLEKYIPETRIVGPKIVVNEFFRTLSQEIDFKVESNNMSKIAENMVEFPDIVIPRVYKAHSTHRILTLEKLEGIRVNDIKAIDAAGVDRKRIVEVGAKAFFKSVMIDGIFHGDLHGGNLFVLPGNRLGVIDFGIVGRLSEKSRDQLASMVMSLLTEDYENLCYEYAELGGAGASIDFDGFQREVRNTLAPYMGLSLSELNLGRVLIEATKIATRYDVKVPGDWMIVFKAILTIEGMGRTLDPNFDLLAMGEGLVKDLVKKQYSMQRFSKEALFIAKDVVSLLQVLPRQLRWMLRKFNSNDFAFEIKSPDLKVLTAQVDRSSRRISYGVVAGALFISASIALQNDRGDSLAGYPFFFVVFLAIASVMTIAMLFRTFK